MIDKGHTIAQIKKIKKNSEQSTFLTKKIFHLLFKKKIKDFEIEDFRILIGQNESLELCIPLALEILKENIMAEGDFYPGDLLTNTLQVNIKFWNDHKDLKDKLSNLLINKRDFIFNYDISDDIKNKLNNLFEDFFK